VTHRSIIRFCKPHNLVVAAWHVLDQRREEGCSLQTRLEHSPNVVADCDKVIPAFPAQYHLGSMIFPKHSTFKPAAKVRNRPTLPDKGGNLVADFLLEIVQLVLNAFSSRHQACLKLSEHPPQILGISDQTCIRCVHLSHRVQRCSELWRQERHFHRKKAAQNPSRSMPQCNGFPMLLVSNCCRFLSDLSGPLRRSVREHCNESSRHCSANTDHNRRPVGHVSPIHRERANRHRYFPMSMMEPILP